MTTLINWLRRLWRRPTKQDRQTLMHRPEANDSDNVILNDQAVTRLMQQIEQTQAGMFTCEETDALLDEYVELAVDDADAARLMPLVERHLAVCPGCHEKFEILQDILKDNPQQA